MGESHCVSVSSSEYPTLAPSTGTPFRVTVRDDKPVASEEAAGPLDPVRRINYQPTGMGAQVQGANNETLHLSHFSSFHIDGQVFQQQLPARYEYMNRPLPKGKGRKPRQARVAAAVRPASPAPTMRTDVSRIGMGVSWDIFMCIF